MKNIITIACMTFIVNVQAQTFVTIPDANFVTYLQGLIPSAMSGNQLNTSSPLVTTTTHSINVYFSNISDLTGIQYFTSLTYLNCSYNPPLSSLPALPNTLTYLNCLSNYITSLPTLPASLKHLDCSSNELTSLPTLPTSLTFLNCGGNFFTNLPATLPASLDTLICYGDGLTGLPVLPNTLTYLDCDSNNISCFPTFPNSIQTLIIYNTHYNCLPNYVLPAMNSYTNTPLCAVGNSNGCAVATTGVEQHNQSNKANIYPNPNYGSFVIETNGDEKQTMQLYDANGKLVLSQPITGKTTIDASNLNEGVYNISITSNEGIVNKKLVIVK